MKLTIHDTTSQVHVAKIYKDLFNSTLREAADLFMNKRDEIKYPVTLTLPNKEGEEFFQEIKSFCRATKGMTIFIPEDFFNSILELHNFMDPGEKMEVTYHGHPFNCFEYQIEESTEQALRDGGINFCLTKESCQGTYHD
jgi:hypothetical protein